MKSWKRPVISNLNIKQTYDDVNFLGNNKNSHYCHAEGRWHGNGCGHPHNNQCKEPHNSDHGWAGNAHESKCCCKGVSIS